MKTPFRPLTQAITLARSEKPKQKIKKCTATLSMYFFFFFSQFLVIQINQIQIAPEQRTPFVFSLCLSFILPTATTTTTSPTLCCVWCPIKCLWLPLLLFQFQLLSLPLSHALFNAPSFSLPLGPFPTRPDPPHSLSIPAPSLGFHLHLLISLSSFSARANPKVLSLSLSDSTIFVAFDLWFCMWILVTTLCLVSEKTKKKLRETCRSYCISLLLLNLWLKKVLVVIFSFFSSFLLYNRVSWSLVTESKS